MREPNNIIGPQKNRVPTVLITNNYKGDITQLLCGSIQLHYKLREK